MTSTDANTNKSIREIATHLQVGDDMTAYAQMEILAIFAGVAVSTVYAVAEEVRDLAVEQNVIARDLALPPHQISTRLDNLNRI